MLTSSWVESGCRVRRSSGERSSAWSPNPKNPPLYLDLPSKNGQVQPEVIAKWAANAPLAFVDQYIANLKRYRGIAIDVGDQDGLLRHEGDLLGDLVCLSPLPQ